MQIINAPIKNAGVDVAAFDLDNARAYRQWRDRRLAGYPASTDGLRVPVADPAQLTGAELAALRDRIQRCNMAIYAIDPAQTGREPIRALGRQLGLEHLDGNLCADEDSLTALQVIPEGRQQGYIPYSNLPLSWHTDGYYNKGDQMIRAMLLHCVRPAASGGENALLDHEIAYIHLRDTEPAYISALMAADAMTIPPNVEQGVEIRGARSGPVFSVDGRTGSLHMRYTHRQRSIEWKADTLTREAVACLREFLASESDYIFRHRLAPGEGIVCNNVLHSRSGFDDDPAQPRLLYRARYYDRISET
ncbi:TauD/TfdA family dioxygenase [Thiohalophilus thiocyanatoxydans]|uniref:Alpha-ketoglutarate-dependent taurine dioxygenase n=1 Tax=Thiohalophilus thiocyanatoxydans TaxID=381308 RepID=A0A4R8IQZ5_9GAMM|nr:TauD/TfdA family dioxygenase [Thiohalophilus thiocyanatoxydans]TDY02744.1 alpha-ketoglutarate-dependent taurine dioxygenase [Thiohalophilus thiocyanatoxydans]